VKHPPLTVVPDQERSERAAHGCALLDRVHDARIENVQLSWSPVDGDAAHAVQPIDAAGLREFAHQFVELGARRGPVVPHDEARAVFRVLDRQEERDLIVAFVVTVLDRLEYELESARKVQLGMVPIDFSVPTAAGQVEIFATLEPARQIGGDLYDFFWGEDGKLYFVIADVSDKGAPAALFMARTKTMIRMVATLAGTQDGVAVVPSLIIKKVNEELCLDNRQGMFVTAIFGVLDPATALVSFCNAGHNAPYIVSGKNGVVPLAGPRSKPLGIRPTFSYETGTHKLDPGDCLFLYTDGITEAMDPAGDWFSEERLEQALHPLAGEAASTVVGKVIAAVREFAATAPQADDIAALAIRRSG